MELKGNAKMKTKNNRAIDPKTFDMFLNSQLLMIELRSIILVVVRDERM